jgi:type I restriction enzyme, S subunit
MQDLLTKGIDENGNIRSKATHKFVVKNGIEVPEEWEVYGIGDIVEQIGSGVTPKGGSNVYIHSGVMLIRSQNVLKGEFDFSDVAYISDEINSRMKRSELRDLDVLLNITGASIGRSHFLPIGFPKANVNQHVCIIRLCEKSLGKSLFLSTYLNDFKGQNQIKRLLGSSNREGLNFQQIREIKVGMPKIEFDDEFERIRKIFESQNDSIDILKLNLAKLQYLKTGLMQDLLSGKVRVKTSEPLIETD